MYYLFNQKKRAFKKIYMGMTSKTQVTKEKLGKMDFIKIQNFCVSKDTMKKVKKKLTKREKTFASHISD